MGVTQPTRGRERERERERVGNREKTAKMGKSTLLTFLGTRIHGAVFQFYHSQLVSFFSSPPTLPIAKPPIPNPNTMKYTSILVK